MRVCMRCKKRIATGEEIYWGWGDYLCQDCWPTQDVHDREWAQRAISGVIAFATEPSKSAESN